MFQIHFNQFSIRSNSKYKKGMLIAEPYFDNYSISYIIIGQIQFRELLRTNKMSGLVAHDLSCFICTSKGAYEADKITTGDLRK
jgi:hypothetical protein